MSFISPKNFIEPVMNKVYLTLIILVVLLFAVFRFSGGGVSVSNLAIRGSDSAGPRKNKVRTQQLQVDSSASQFEDRQLSDIDEILGGEPKADLKRGTKRFPQGVPAKDNNSDGDFLDSLVVGQGVKKSPPPQPTRSGGLDDIEKSLGLK